MASKAVSAIADFICSRAERRAQFERAHAQRFATTAEGEVIGAETVFLPRAGGRAALLLHGFNDTPQSMAFLAAALHRAGWSVLAPRLAGHGVTLPRMAREARAAAWRAQVSDAYASLRQNNHTVVVCGQSMGGALAALLAEAHPEMPALVLLAPYLGMPAKIQLQAAVAWLLHVCGPYRRGRGGEGSIHDPEARASALSPGVITAHSMTALRSIALSARAALPRVRVPTLYLQSREDNRISVTAATRSFGRLCSAEKVQRWLTGCGHIISADYCRDEVAEAVASWFVLHAALPVSDTRSTLPISASVASPETDAAAG